MRELSIFVDEAGQQDMSDGYYLLTLYRGNAMRELSIFVDEAGQQDMSDGYYLLTLVLHDQSAPIGEHIEEYEGQLRAGGLPTSRSTWFACSTATGTTTGLTPT